MKTFKIIFMLLVIFNNQGITQNDTTLIAKNAKLLLYAELENQILDEQEINSFFELPLKIEGIKSEGFINLIFFKISNQPLTKVKLENGDESSLMMPFPKSSKNFILAYSSSGNNLFKIAGFDNNDLNYIIKNKSFYISNDIDKKCLRKKNIHKCLSIEDVDMSSSFSKI